MLFCCMCLNCVKEVKDYVFYFKMIGLYWMSFSILVDEKLLRIGKEVFVIKENFLRVWLCVGW